MDQSELKLSKRSSSSSSSSSDTVSTTHSRRFMKQWMNYTHLWAQEGLDFLPEATFIQFVVYIFWSLVLGVLIALLVAALRYLVHETEALFYYAGAEIAFLTGGPAYTPINTLIGNVSVGLFTGVVTHRFFKELVGSGVVASNIAMALGTQIPLYVLLLRFFLTLVFLSGNTPVGMEGPVLHMSAALGSAVFTLGTAPFLPKILRLPANASSTLMVIGFSGGLSAAFNTPLAGVIFGIEETMNHRNLGMSTGIMALTSLSAAIVTRLIGELDGSENSVWHFHISKYLTHDLEDTDLHWSYLAAIPIGILSGLAASLFVKGILVTRSLFYKAKWLPPQYRLTVVGVFTGVGAIIVFWLLRIQACHATYTGFFSTSHGIGNQVVDSWFESAVHYAKPRLDKFEHLELKACGHEFVPQDLLTNAQALANRNLAEGSRKVLRNWAVWEPLVLGIGKFLGALLVTAAGGSGGIFSPALFIGGSVGYTFELIIDAIFPHKDTLTNILFPLCIIFGMAGFFAGLLRLPLTSVAVVYEMTSLGSLQAHYIIPIMGAAFIAFLVSGRIDSESLYDRMMRQDGLDPHEIFALRFVKRHCAHDVESQEEPDSPEDQDAPKVASA